MSYLNTLTRAEIDGLGPPTPEELADTEVPETFLRDLALKNLATISAPTTANVAEQLHLPRSLTEELLRQLYREKLIEILSHGLPGTTRYAMLDHGWERVGQVRKQCGYAGPAPVSLADYSYMMRLQAVPFRAANMEMVRAAFRDLVLPESLLQTLGCVINSRSSLFLTGLPGTGKTAVSERINAALGGSIWIPYAVEVDGYIIRIFDSRCHRAIVKKTSVLEHDRRWIEIERPVIRVGGELTLENTALVWSETSKVYEAPFHLKSNGGTLIIDHVGRQPVPPHSLLNRWIQPLERRVDFLTLSNGNQIEVPFEQLVVFSSSFAENEIIDEAFLRRLGYRARIEMPTRAAYLEIFKRAAHATSIELDTVSLN